MEDSATITESSLLSKLQSSSDPSIHHLFSSYLHPFTTIINKPKKQSKSNAETSTIIRSLAKKFISFLSIALNLFPKRLNETPKIDSCYASELFEAYKLCISCLESVSSMLTCKPHFVQSNRVKLMICYDNWGKYEDAQNEGFLALEFIRKLSGKRSGNPKGRVIPELWKENVDKDVSVLILEVVVTHANCVLNGRRKEGEDYTRLHCMVDEVQPWLRFVDPDTYEKLYKKLVTYLNKCTLFLVGELARFDRSLVQSFCVLTFSELKKLSMNDQMEMFGFKICSSFFSQLDKQFLCSVDILTCVLDAMAHECKNGKEKSLGDFSKLADFCATKCRFANVDICGTVANHFNKLAAEFSQVSLLQINMIMRLYAITLSIGDLNSYSNKGNTIMSKVLLNMEDQLQSLTTTHGSLTCQCKVSAEVPLYFTALRFLCEPISKVIISKCKDIFCGIEDVSFSIKLPNVQDAFHQFRVVFLAYRTSERYVNEDMNMQTVLTVAAAAITLSFATNENLKESTTFLKDLISADWVPLKGLKYLSFHLHNVGMALYNINRSKEATKSFKLSCQAAWNHIILLSKMLTSSKDGVISDVSQDAIAVCVTNACAKTAVLMHILHQCGSNKISKILTDSLESWSVAHSLLDTIPSPVALIRQWVKIECEQVKDLKDGLRIPKIYSLMSSFKMSKETFGVLLEEVLQVYRELKSRNPTLCETMQMTITNILLKEIYNTEDSCLQKSRVLIAKARESRAYGVEGLNHCIECLSEAISIMVSYKSKDGSGPVCNLLAEAYCLRALCTQEAQPNSKCYIEDVGNALKLWMSQEHSQSSEQIQNPLTLLYYVADLLSLKGYVEHHAGIYETMIRFFKWKNIPLQKCLNMLWQSRSLSHALCGSPVSDAFIMTISDHCNLSKSLEFWISCMERSKSLEVGLRQSFSVISTLSTPDSCKHDHATQPHIATDEVKQAAFDLMNSVPLSNKSLFLAAHLYYDLAERMTAKGLMIEALHYAKEAHRLRAELFPKTFMHSIKPQNYIYYMHPAKAVTAWPYDKGSGDFDDCILTPWNVLKVFLESILQLGTIQEIVGNGSEAKTLLQFGKDSSSFQDFPIFVVEFSCALGKLYREQLLWDLAEKELESAKHILADSCCLISCLKCKLVLEVTVDQQLGDLFQSRFNCTSVNKLLEGLSKAETLYRSGIDKLKVPEWKNCVSNCDEASARNTMFCDSLLVSGQETIQPKATRKSKRTAKPLRQQMMTSRITRSYKQRSEYAQNVDCITTCGCEVTCASYEVMCWHCLPFEIMKSTSLRSIIQMKWECIRRRLLLRLLVGIGKSFGVRGEIQKACEVLLESVSVLVNRSTFCPSRFSISIAFLAELIEKNVTADVFAVEHASLLYNICWFSLKSFCNNGTRNNGCDMLITPIPTVVSALKLSFIMCRGVPLLLQKVSRLLAVLYSLSSSNKAFSMLSPPSNVLSESQWASYFHQASLGTNLNHKLFFHNGKRKNQNTMDVDGSSIPNSTHLSLLRLAPDSVMDLEEFISKFFEGLPHTTIICLSMLGDDFATLLKELLPYDSHTHVWMILSRLNSDSVPIVILLPINPILAGTLEDNEDSSSSFLFNKKRSDISWSCPWGHTIIDDVAPLFKMILEGNYISASAYPLEDTKNNWSLWWSQRTKLDQWLSDLLRDVEDLWFGPWKHLLLGECSDNKHLSYVLQKLKNDLKSECKVDVDENILKVLTGSVGNASNHVECLSQLIFKKGCYVGGTKCLNNECHVACSRKQEKINSVSSVSKLILNAINEIGEENLVDREPVILVLDFDIQMLPWENLPVLRNQEVYRMPSVASICSTFDRCCQYHNKVGKDHAVFPMIDPLDAYYLLNPNGDFPNTEAVFANWFEDQNLEGTTGTLPTEDELRMALKNHDLFMYFGHDSGLQYIRSDEIQKLDGCAATLLMGCKSGCLSLNGSYIPQGAPLYYLFAGSPVIVANLWEVTDKDIDRFGKAVVDAWISTRPSSLVDCTQCIEISDKLKNMNIDEDKRKGRKRTSRKKSVESREVNTCTLGCKHRPKIGSFMGKSRQACKLPFLVGASPVCYGVPTCIRNKDL